jgi:hypothetical protein
VNTSLVELGMIGLATALSIAFACWMARRTRRALTGILVGTAVGVALIFLSSALVGFLGQVLPVGQIDYWLAHMIQGVW